MKQRFPHTKRLSPTPLSTRFEKRKKNKPKAHACPFSPKHRRTRVCKYIKIKTPGSRSADCNPHFFFPLHHASLSQGEDMLAHPALTTFPAKPNPTRFFCFARPGGCTGREERKILDPAKGVGLERGLTERLVPCNRRKQRDRLLCLSTRRGFSGDTLDTTQQSHGVKAMEATCFPRIRGNLFFCQSIFWATTTEIHLSVYHLDFINLSCCPTSAPSS